MAIPKLAKYGLWAGLAYVGFQIFTKVQAVASFNVLVTNVKLLFRGIIPTVVCDITIQNPTKESFTVSSLTGDIFVNNTLIGQISDFTDEMINPNSESKISVDVPLSLNGVADQISSMINNRNVTMNVLINGSLKLNGVPLPVHVTYKLV
jgi:LEA14-like dessication related protein